MMNPAEPIVSSAKIESGASGACSRCHFPSGRREDEEGVAAHGLPKGDHARDGGRSPLFRARWDAVADDARDRQRPAPDEPGHVRGCDGDGEHEDSTVKAAGEAIDDAVTEVRVA